MSYDNRNSGVLFRNQNKETDKHPDYTGSWTDEDGHEFFMSAWINESKSGKKFLKLSRGKSKEAKAPKDYAQKSQDFDDSMPF